MSDYKIYPSLLDKYQRFLDSGKDFESHFNQDADGNYKRSLEEISKEREQALLDAVNRKPHDPIEAADIGTVFNELVDWVLVGTGWEKANVLFAEENGTNYSFSAELVKKSGRDREVVSCAGLRAARHAGAPGHRHAVRLHRLCDRA